MGAQNHNATGRPANCVKSIAPPPTEGAENCRAAGAEAFEATDDVAPVSASFVAASAVDVVEPSPLHEVSAHASDSTASVIRDGRIGNDRIALA